MLHISHMGSGDSHAFLVAFCKLAMDLYPDLDWSQVEPKLERSWTRYLEDADGLTPWSMVREHARVRWETRSPSLVG